MYLSFSTVLAIQSQVYAYVNDLSKLMKEIGNREKQAYEEGRLVQLWYFVLASAHSLLHGH